MKYFYIYKVELPETGEFYFGSRETKIKPENDKYKGSMYRWKPDKSRLKKTILEKFNNRKDLILAEEKIIRENIKKPFNRNYHIPTLSKCLFKTSLPDLIEKFGEIKGTKIYREICQKLSDANKGRILTEEHKRKISKSEKGKEISKECREKISGGLKKAYDEGRKIVPDYSGENHPMYGKNHSEESKKKIGEAGKGRIHSDETKAKMSKIKKGKKKSEETKKKMRKPKSPEAIENMRIAQRLRRLKESS